MTARRVAIVTGAARGIGAALVERLADDGWALHAIDVVADDPALPYPLANEADLAGVVSAANERAGEERVRSYRADVRDLAGLTAAVAEAEATWGGVDAAIACAGVIAGGAPHRFVPVDQEKAVLEVDLVGVLNLARVVVPALLRRPEPRTGRFVAVASAAATRGLPDLAAYCAAKAGVLGFVRALAVELGPSGITANAVNPGSTDTAMLTQSARLYSLPDKSEFRAHQPINRLLSPAEIVEAIAFLVSPASGAITGAAVAVDGGLAV